MKTVKQIWGVFYEDSYKRKLVQECGSFEQACEERMNWSFNNEGDPGYFVDEITEDDCTPIQPIRDNIELLSGQVQFPYLKAPKVKEYEIKRAQLWVKMINDGKRPTKWLSATKKGTKVNFDFIGSNESREQALDEFKSYLEEVNGIYGLNMKLK